MKNQTDRWTPEHRLQEEVRAGGRRYQVGERTLVSASQARRHGRVRPVGEVSPPEELNCSMIGGGAMMLWGLLRGNLGGMIHAAIGGLLLYRGMNRQCPFCGAGECGHDKTMNRRNAGQSKSERES